MWAVRQVPGEAAKVGADINAKWKTSSESCLKAIEKAQAYTGLMRKNVNKLKNNTRFGYDMISELEVIGK